MAGASVRVQGGRVSTVQVVHVHRTSATVRIVRVSTVPVVRRTSVTAQDVRLVSAIAREEAVLVEWAVRAEDVPRALVVAAVAEAAVVVVEVAAAVVAAD